MKANSNNSGIGLRSYGYDGNGNATSDGQGHTMTTGTTSLSAHDGSFNILGVRDWLAYDQQDEIEAYKRQGLFGSTYNSLPSAYNNRPNGPISLLDIPAIIYLNTLPPNVGHAQLQKLADRANMAFRLNGSTYGPTDK